MIALLSTTAISYFYLINLVSSISVPTGKDTPIEPAVIQPKILPIPGNNLQPPAPVHEYTEERPEPPPLDPSFVPIPYDYIEYLSPRRILLVPMKIKIQRPYSKYEKYLLSAPKYQRLMKNDNLRRKYYSTLQEQNEIPDN
ncbi:uncharacterized protein LOC126896272 [Daktulosphaira vitifoliae]|uniref:uncharacterized protein LOC126896272 n=1 Tax=Daktulosphaira vitifoliae TaxID=58002 RepID=UPI0021AA646F|nr:uncharacterized protein LOC126896272 [Daktulosphaira vitifoliae]